ncbi:MAG: DUF4349 domain-containing protein [Cytophagales bacterium]|nr:MAG: DUF4349 domain-containing protein [Cytophagales bacterium]
MKNLIRSLIIFGLSAFSCSKSENRSGLDMSNAVSSSSYASDNMAVQEEAMISDAVEVPKPLENNSKISENTEQKIIKTASVRFQVEDFKKSAEKLKRIAKDFGGINTSYNENNNGYNIEASFIVRITNSKFDTLLNALQTESIYLNYKNINAEDVTEEFIDIESRLKNKKAVEQKYLEILKKASRIDDILAVENQIRIIREEIEAKEGRLKYLKDRIAYSTINLTFYQNLENYQAPDISFWSKIKSSFSDGWSSIQNLGLWIVSIWPFVILVIIIFYFVKKKWKKK